MRRRPLHIGLGLGLGPESGVGVDPLSTVTKDATSGIYLPSSAGEWSTFIAARSLSIATPNSLWLCQEASGNLADSIGSVTLTASGTPLYQQTITGWTRKGAGASADGGSDKFVAAAGTGPNPSTTSATWLAVIKLPAAPAAARAFWGYAVTTSATAVRILHNTTGKIRTNIVNTNSADGASDHSSLVSAFVIKYDRTNSAGITYTNLDKVAGTYASGAADQNKGLGAANSGASLALMLYGCMWSGANGEISDANVKALLQAMGYTISWS